MTSSLLLPLLLLLAVFMFLATRRQKREAKAVQDMQDALAPGDEVMTTSGLRGTVVALGEDTADLEIAPGVVTTWNRLAIRQLVTADDELDGTEDDAVDDDTIGDGAVEADEPARTRLTKD